MIMKCKKNVNYLILTAIITVQVMTIRMTPANAAGFDLVNDQNSYKVQPESSLNSEYDDFSPVFYGNGMVFTTNRHAGRTQKTSNEEMLKTRYKLYYSAPDQEGHWQIPRTLYDAPDFGGHTGPVVFSASQDTMLFTTGNTHHVNQDKILHDPTYWTTRKEPGAQAVRLEIFFAERIRGSWGNFIPFPYNNPEEYNVGHPALSPDGKTLYFVSDKKGEEGRTDLYYSVYNERHQEWEQPISLGDKINTSGRELFPVVAPDGTLFFSSDGGREDGILDLYAARGKHDQWEIVRRLDYPFSSNADDFGISFHHDGPFGFFASSRNGQDDIYVFTKEGTNLAQLLSGDFQEEFAEKTGTGDAETNWSEELHKTERSTAVLKDEHQEEYKKAQKSKVDAQVSEKSLYHSISKPDPEKTANNKPLPESNVQTVKAGEKTVKANNAEQDDFKVAVVEYDFPKTRQLIREFDFQTIHYDLNSADLLPSARRELDKIVKAMQRYPDIIVELSSYTDIRGDYAYNIDLSMERSMMARDYLVSQGVNPSRLIARGFGSGNVVNHCREGVHCRDSLHRQNRRTVFRVVDK
jgi:outer membrane protein OmpA-like peptidoglycan-associated protein